jgi:hypothetical protein
LRLGSAGCSAECTGRSDRLIVTARPHRAETQNPARPPPLWPCCARRSWWALRSRARSHGFAGRLRLGRVTLQQALLGRPPAATNLPPHNANERRSPAEAVTPRRHGRYLGKAGKISSGAPMSRSARTACWPSRRAWSSTAFWQFFPPSPRWFLCMNCRKSLRNQ